jgi:ribonuclease ZC3H12
MRGIILVIQYFKNRGHEEIVCFLPRSFQHRSQSPSEQQTVSSLEKENIITYTPSKKNPDGKRVTPYDDRYCLFPEVECLRVVYPPPIVRFNFSFRFIVIYATERQGVIISNDGYRDLAEEDPAWKETIEKRLVYERIRIFQLIFQEYINN